MEKIINLVGLQFDPKLEILEFHEMVEAKQDSEKEETEPNSFEFFAQALLYFEGEAKGKLSSTEQSPDNPVESWNKRIDINSIKTTIIQEYQQELSKLLEEPTSTHERSSDLSFGEVILNLLTKFPNSTSPSSPNNQNKSKPNKTSADLNDKLL